VTDRDRIKQAMALLRRSGYWARMDAADCRACMNESIEARATRNGVPFDEVRFAQYTRQDALSLNKRGRLVRPLYLSWQGDPKEIEQAFLDAGLFVLVPDGPAKTFVVPVPSVQVVWNPYARDGAGGYVEERWTRWQ
jgi:hypothetical protein